MFFTKTLFAAILALSVAAAPLSTTSPLDTTLSESTQGLTRRAFPIVNGLNSVTAITPRRGQQVRNAPDDTVNKLASNYDKYLEELQETEKHPPKPPSGAADFLKQYRVTVGTTSLEVIDDFIDDATARQLGFQSKSDQVTEVTIEAASTRKKAYEFVISRDGKSIAMVYSFTDKDPNKASTATNAKLSFEDIIAFAMAYAADRDAFGNDKEVDAAVANAVKKVTHIGRLLISNALTESLILRAFSDNKWTEKSKFNKVDLNTKIGKALLATANGSFATKLLGSNMAALKHGKIDSLYIRGSYMAITLAHG